MKRSSSATTTRQRPHVRKKHRLRRHLPNLERRYRETESPTVREELAKYLGIRPCPDCGGTRLNRTARCVFVGEHTLPDIAHLTVGKALELFGSLQSRRLARRGRRTRSSRM